MNGSDLIKKVTQNTNLFRTRMKAAGFNIIVSKILIICVALFINYFVIYMLCDNTLTKSKYL